MASAKFYGTGRRKKSIARVYLVPGTGNITINKRDIDEYLGLETLKLIVRQPLVATETVDKFDVLVNVRGGGTTGQAGAIRGEPFCSEEGWLPDPRSSYEGAQEVRSQSSSSRSAVQQAIIDCSDYIKMVQKPRKIKVFRGFLVPRLICIV